MKKLLLVCLATFICAVTLHAQKDEIKEFVKEGDTLPAFVLNSTINGTINSAELKGKVVLINIFATWCPPCQSELAEIQKTLWPKFKDNKDFCLLVVGREHTDDDLVKYNERKKFTFPLYPDPKREFTSKFATGLIPRSYLVNKEGKVIAMAPGYSPQVLEIMMQMIEKELK